MLVDATIAAEQLRSIRPGLTAQRLWTLARQGVIPAGAVVREGRRVFFDVEALLAFYRDGGTVQATQQPSGLRVAK